MQFFLSFPAQNPRETLWSFQTSLSWIQHVRGKSPSLSGVCDALSGFEGCFELNDAVADICSAVEIIQGKPPEKGYIVTGLGVIKSSATACANLGGMGVSLLHPFIKKCELTANISQIAKSFFILMDEFPRFIKDCRSGLANRVAQGSFVEVIRRVVLGVLSSIGVYTAFGGSVPAIVVLSFSTLLLGVEVADLYRKHRENTTTN